MFNRKKKIIENLKNNLSEINSQRLQLRNENIIYQKELVFLRDMVKENNEMLKKLTIKPKKTKKEVKKSEQ